MPDLLAAMPLLFAADAPPAGPTPNSWMTLLPFIGIPFFFYFLIIRPKQVEDRKRQSMIDALNKNDKVMTAAGIHGTVVSLDPSNDRVVLRVDDDRGVKLTFSRSAIVKVVETSQEKAAESA